MAHDILDAVYGCLIGGAIGDALGAPAENLYYDQVRERYGRIADLRAYDNVRYSTGQAGAVTDDTTLRHYMCLAIVRKGGRITPDDAARVWREDLNPDRFWSPDKITWRKLQAGMEPRDAGKGNIPSACATMAMTPIGIINAGDPAQAYQDGWNVASMQGDGPHRDGAAMVAAGVAAALAPGATVESILEAMTARSSDLMRRSIELTLDLAQASAPAGAGIPERVEAFTVAFYDRLIDWWSRPRLNWDKTHFPNGTSVESVSITLALLYLCQGQVNHCLVEAANFGRDADSIANLVGSIAGAWQGASAVRADWVAQVEAANRPFFEELEGDPEANFHSMAVRMVEALRGELRATEVRVEMLQQMGI
jgi:ADP-ribosylglycohydrolase